MKKRKWPGYVPWLYHNMKGRAGWIILLMLSCALSGWVTVQISMSTRAVINGAVGGGRDGFLRAGAAHLGWIVLSILLNKAGSYLTSYVKTCLNQDFKRSLLQKILRCDYAAISRFSAGDLVQRMGSDAAAAYGGVMGILTGLFGMVSLLVSSLLALLSIAPGFTVMLTLSAAVLGIFVYFVKDRLKQLQKESSAAGGRVSGFLYESIYKLMMVQALDVSQEMMHRAEGVLKHSWDVQRRQRNMSLFTGLGSSLLVQGTGVVTLVWGGWQLLEGRLSYGDVTALLALVGSTRNSIMGFPAMIPQLVSIAAACERIMEVVDLPDQPQPDREDPLGLYDAMTGIRLRDLSFGYDREMVMDHVNLTIPKEGLTVVVGPSGIGKSTLLKLLLGLYRPGAGELTLQTRRGEIQLSRAARTLFSYAPQGNFLLSGTLRENLTLTRPDATEEEIANALYVSAMDEYVSTLPCGLETVLHENGTGLSEGQAQRLSLARAVLSGAPVLLLDEVTSALDAATEHRVLQRICAMKNRTCIAVTHRPAALELADHVIEVSDGSMRLRSVLRN